VENEDTLSAPKAKSYKMELFPLSPLDTIKKMFIQSELAKPIDSRLIEQNKMIPVKPDIWEEESQARRSARIQSLNPRTDHFYVYNPPTPMLFSPGTYARLKPKLDKDIEKIEADAALEEEQDPEYIDYDKDYGKTVETWYADNLPCPCCGQIGSLVRYSSDIFPIIDLVCLNPDHDNNLALGVRYFQVKASNGNLFRGDKYFDVGSPGIPGHIHTGSRKAGEPIHQITGLSSPHDKSFAIGYICVSIGQKYIYKPDYPYYDVEQINWILPDLTKESGLYYSYVEESVPGLKPKITWNLSNFITFGSDIKYAIPRDYLLKHHYEVIPNSLSTRLHYEDK
jgi:hypothetical protein